MCHMTAWKDNSDVRGGTGMSKSIINPAAKFGRERTSHKNEYKAGTPGAERAQAGRTLNSIQRCIRQAVGTRRDFIRLNLLGAKA